MRDKKNLIIKKPRQPWVVLTVIQARSKSVKSQVGVLHKDRVCPLPRGHCILCFDMPIHCSNIEFISYWLSVCMIELAELPSRTLKPMSCQSGAIVGSAWKSDRGNCTIRRWTGCYKPIAVVGSGGNVMIWWIWVWGKTVKSSFGRCMCWVIKDVYPLVGWWGCSHIIT